jgi:hypothetical protein
LLVLDEEAYNKEESNNIKRAAKRRIDQMLEGNAIREDLGVD